MAGGRGYERKLFRRESDLAFYDDIRIPIWVFDVVRHKIWWANRSALQFWRASSVEDLCRRDFSSDSEMVRTRLMQVVQNTLPGEYASESWTLYPHGHPVTVVLDMQPVRIEEGRDAVLIQATTRLDMESDPQFLRLFEAARYTSLMISCFARDGRCLSENPAAQAAYDISLFREKFAPGGLKLRFSRQRDYRKVLSAIERGEDIAGDFPMRTAAGRRWHHLDVRMGRDPVTGERIAVVTEEDIHARKQALEELARVNRDLDRRIAEQTRSLHQALDAARQASKAKSMFLAKMSHELRTPLNAIIGFSEMIENEMLGPVQPPAYKDYAEYIHQSGQYLLALISDILDLSKIDAGGMVLHEGAVDLRRILEESIELLAGRLKEKNIELVKSSAGPSVPFWGDGVRLRQIFINIIGNAVKFTPSGGRIEITCRVTDDGGIMVRIADNGTGIEASDLPKLFMPFTQGAQDASQPQEGTGLGLSIAKSLVELHDGRIAVDSVYGEGTTVSMIFPASRLNPVQKAHSG